MAFFAKNKLIYYKKFKLDIWGLFYNTLQSLHDKTVYKLSYKYFTLWLDRKIKNQRLKETLDLKSRYIKARDTYFYNVKNKLPKSYKSPGSIKTDFEKFLDKSENMFDAITELVYLKRRILLLSLLSKYVSQIKISRKINKIFILLMQKKKKKQRVYFRKTFIYETREPKISIKKRKFNFQFATLRIIKLFYIMYSYRQLKFIAKKAKSKFGVFEQNYLYIMECKLPSYIYRSSLLSNLFDSIKFVKCGNVWINKQFKPLLYFNVSLYDIVGFRVIYKGYIFWNFFRRLRRKAFMFMFNRCIYISLPFLFTILIHMFLKKDIINAFNVDIIE